MTSPNKQAAQQLPPLPNSTGDRVDEEGETFEEWLERLELIAVTCPEMKKRDS